MLHNVKIKIYTWYRDFINQVSGLKNFWKFRKAIMKYRWYDSSYLYTFIVDIMKDMEVNMREKGHATSEHIDNVCRDISIARTCLKRIKEDDYCKDAYNTVFTKYSFEWCEDTESGFYMLADNLERDKVLKYIQTLETNQRKLDWELFIKKFKQSQRWWD